MRNRILLLFLLTGTGFMFFVMRWHGKPLTQNPIAKTGIVALEFAKTKQRAHAIVTVWKNNGIQQHAVTNTAIDYIFIFFYGLFLFAANWQYALSKNKHLQPISQAIALMSLLAALFDVIENYFLFKMLAFNCTAAEIYITWHLAAVKFLLVAIALLWIIFNLVHRIIIKPKTLTS